MKRSFSFLLMILPALAAIMAAEVSGIVINTAVDQPEPYATVRIYAQGDSVKAAALTTTDEQGRFCVNLPPAPGYRIIVQAVGSAVSEQTFDIADDSATDLGTLSLSPSNELAEVSVTAQRPLVKREIDRLNYDVQADEEARTATVLEILRKVPMVTIDADGNIKIKGSSSIKIYKNGRINKAFTQNPRDIFTSIPASMIKRIEVITDPGAREDAEGATMILNIVTMDATEIYGVTGTVSLRSSTNSPTPRPDVYVTAQLNKFTFSAYGGLTHQGRRSSRSVSESAGTFATTGSELITKEVSTSRRLGGWSGLEASFELDTLNLFTAEFSVFPMSIRSYADQSTAMLNPDGTPGYSYNTSQITWPERNNRFYIDGAFNYQRSTRRRGETITLSYQISNSNNRSNSITDYKDMINPPVPYTAVTASGRTRFTEHTVQIDWIHPFTDRSKLDVGAKYIHRRNAATSLTDYKDYRTDRVDFVHLTQVGAAYADWRYSLSRLNFRAGLRYEFSRLEASYPDGSAASFGSNLNDLVPNAAIAWNVNDVNSLKLSYGMTISRPDIGSLNPTVVESPYMISCGNPRLGSAHYHNLNLAYSLTLRRLYLEANAGLTLLNDAVAQVRAVDGDVITSTYANIDRQRQASLSVYAQWTPFDNTQVMLNSTYGYGRCSSPPLGLSLSMNVFSEYLSVSQKLPWKLSLIASAGYSNGFMLNVYQYMRYIHGSCWDWDVSLQRSFLRDDRLTVSLFWNRPFGPTTRCFRTYSVNSDYTGIRDNIGYRQTWASVRVSFRFGTLNASVKKTAASISNTDRQSHK